MASNLFPLNNFKYCLTLFSKFFSSFPHGTCSLSVSRQYLALEGFTSCLGLHSQTTRLCESASWSVLHRSDGVLTLCDVPFQGTWDRLAAEDASIDYNSPSEAWRFSSWAFPVHSPLLGESWLVSFPPLIDMLKFSG